MDISARTAKRISIVAWAGAAFGTVFGRCTPSPASRLAPMTSSKRH